LRRIYEVIGEARMFFRLAFINTRDAIVPPLRPTCSVVQ
jgi:hypothetical protein